MKININYTIKSEPWGGGNQFLKCLREDFRAAGVYEDDPVRADVILCNSHHELERVLEIKKKSPRTIVVYRVDGPISLIRGKDREIDSIITVFCRTFADGVVFQSNWSREQNKKELGLAAGYETSVCNAADNRIFNPSGKRPFRQGGRVALIASSWSANSRKGFEAYRFLDSQLDFSRYQMTFVGNTPVAFRNIKHVAPLSSPDLAALLKQQDIYVTASESDPCSNSLIEALSCGLPAVARADGGHPEILQSGGELFGGTGDLIEKIEKVSLNYEVYRERIPLFSIEQAAGKYREFMASIFRDAQSGAYAPKNPGIHADLAFSQIKLLQMKLRGKFYAEAVKDKLCAGAKGR